VFTHCFFKESSDMKLSTKVFLIGAAFALTAVAHTQTTVQTDTQTNGQASVQANKTNAQASGGASASSSTSSDSNRTNAGLASGTAFNAALSSPVDSKKSKPGDPVTARTTEGVKSEGKTILPKGTKLIGHVTRASARAKGDSESVLAITFDRAILRNREEVPLNVAMQAIASAQAAAASEADLDTMGSAGASAVGSGMAGSHRAGGGLVSTAGGAVGSVTNTAANVGAAGGAAVNSTLGASVGGLNPAGQFTSNSQGVFGMNGLNLTSVATNGTQGSVITSTSKNVHLDSGTRMLMITETAASTTPNR
jgi:hypothetical protein